jgi:hypothetical protein
LRWTFDRKATLGHLYLTATGQVRILIEKFIYKELVDILGFAHRIAIHYQGGDFCVSTELDQFVFIFRLFSNVLHDNFIPNLQIGDATEDTLRKPTVGAKKELQVHVTLLR